jgi:small subunit ribosomal protein S20
MPNLQNAKKALRVSARKRVFNDRRRRALKVAVKTLKSNLSNDNLSKAFQAIDKAAKNGVIKKNTASRKKSRLAKQVNTIKAVA